jgi:hypothetical protein
MNQREEDVATGIGVLGLIAIFVALVLTSGCALVVPDWASRSKGQDPDRPMGLFVRSHLAPGGECGDREDPSGGAAKKVAVWATVTGQPTPAGATARARVSRHGFKEDAVFPFGETRSGTWTLTFLAGAGPTYKVEFWVTSSEVELYSFTTLKVWDCRLPGAIKGADVTEVR